MAKCPECGAETGYIGNIVESRENFRVGYDPEGINPDTDPNTSLCYSSRSINTTYEVYRCPVCFAEIAEDEVLKILRGM